jgi:hypothetical protein
LTPTNLGRDEPDSFSRDVLNGSAGMNLMNQDEPDQALAYEIASGEPTIFSFQQIQIVQG